MPAPRVFLDASGRAPITTRVADALQAGVAEGWADPARLTAESRKARAVLDGAREAIADALGAEAAHLHIVPSSHVAFDRAIAGTFAARRGRDQIVVSDIERKGILTAAEFVAPGGVQRIGVDQAGHVDPEAFAAALADPAVAIAAVQHANHEIGTIQRLDPLADAAAAHGVPLIVDASASIGHVPAPERWDALLADPADWGAPLGLGVVALRPRTRWLAAWPGDEWAPGGVSIPLALAAAVALQERLEQMEANRTRLAGLIDGVRAAMSQLEGVTVIGDPVERLPHLLTAAFFYLDGEPVVSRLDRDGFAVGSGSACGTETFEPSAVLAAMGALTHGNLRLGLHPGVADADIDRFVAVVPGALEDVRRSMTGH